MAVGMHRPNFLVLPSMSTQQGITRSNHASSKGAAEPEGGVAVRMYRPDIFVLLSINPTGHYTQQGRWGA